MTNSPATACAAKILIADDHEVMRMGIRNLLESRPDWKVCAEASNGQEAIDKTRVCHPDIVIMDITMPVLNGLDAANFLLKAQPGIPIILFSLHLSDDLIGTFAHTGIRGAVCKGDAARDLVDAVEAVLKGGTFFPGTGFSESRAEAGSRGPSQDPNRTASAAN